MIGAMDLSLHNKVRNKPETRASLEEHKNKVRKCLVKHIIPARRFLEEPHNDLPYVKRKTPSQFPLLSGVDRDNRQTSRLHSTPQQATECDVLPMDLRLEHFKHRLPSNMRIKVKNVVSAFKLGCTISLDYISQNAINVEYRKGQNFLRLRLKEPLVMATMWHTGSASIMGAPTITQCRVGARRVARVIQKLGYEVHMHSFHVVNVVSSFVLPFGMHLNNFSIENLNKASCEPEMHTCVIYNLRQPKATFFVHKSGSGTASAASVDLLYEALEVFYRMARKYAVARSCAVTAKLNKKEKRDVEIRFMAKAKELLKTESNLYGTSRHYWDK